MTDISKKEQLQKEYDRIITAYVNEFINLYDFEGVEDNYYWIADQIGGMIDICDYVIGFDDIKYCVDNEVSFEDFNEWYEYGLKISTFEHVPQLSLDAWCKGAPRLSTEQITDLNQRANRIEELKHELENQAKDYVNGITTAY